MLQDRPVAVPAINDRAVLTAFVVRRVIERTRGRCGSDQSRCYEADSGERGQDSFPMAKSPSEWIGYLVITSHNQGFWNSLHVPY